MTEVEIDLYNIKANSHTKFQVKVPKDGREKSRKIIIQNIRSTPSDAERNKDSQDTANGT